MPLEVETWDEKVDINECDWISQPCIAPYLVSEEINYDEMDMKAATTEHNASDSIPCWFPAPRASL